MTEEIINSDGSRNWEANILLDNIKRLEQENKELKEENERLRDSKFRELDRALEAEDKYKSALGEIRENLKKIFNVCDDDCGNASEIAKVVGLINEVLGC